MCADIPFTLSEILLDNEPRLFFSQDDENDLVGEAMFSFNEAGESTSTDISVYTLVSTTTSLLYFS